MKTNEIVTREVWLKARRELLIQEKEFTRQRDKLTRQIRTLPWVKIEQDYQFDSMVGPLTFSDLFDGRSQLIIYHFMMGPGWETGCKSCSFWADNFNEIIVHLNQRDVTMIAVSRAPIQNIEAFKKRMGWSFTWVSSLYSDFNFDYQVSLHREEPAVYNYKEIPSGPEELPGISVFARDAAGTLYHTYSRYARGLDLFNTAYNYLDITPKGRDEGDLSYSQAWVRHHDMYGQLIDH